MKAGGNAEKQSADPFYTLPGKRSKSYVQDNAFYLALSTVGNVLLILGILLISLILSIYYKKTPVVVTQNDGICYKRTTEEVAFSTGSLKTFLRFTLESLLNPLLPDQDPAIFEPFIDPRVVQVATDQARRQNEANQHRRRQYWELEDFIDDKDRRFLTVREDERVRRYDNPQLPQYMGFAVLGKRTTVIDTIALDGSLEKRISSSPSLIIVYLSQTRANPNNPWGLYLNGIQEKINPQEIEQIWQQSLPVLGTEDLNGKPIVVPLTEYIASPLFERIRFFDWYPYYPKPLKLFQTSDEQGQPVSQAMSDSIKKKE